MKVTDPFARMLGSPRKIMANLGNAPAKKRTPNTVAASAERKRRANAAARAASAERKRRANMSFSAAQIRNITAELARKGYKQIKVTDGRGRQYISGTGR